MLLFACLVVFAPACSFIQRVTGPAGQEHKGIADTAGQEHKVITDTTRQTQATIALGEYKKALELCSNSYDRYHYPGLRSSYARTAEQIRNTADSAYQRKDFAEAGSIYNTLFESGITTRDFAQSLSFDDDYLNGQISLCSKALMENGLMKYREEKLDEAIVIWKKALVFDPDNTGIKNSIETATQQLQKLKSLK
jgi:tetratricopeptide (TPR) repeat protein